MFGNDGKIDQAEVKLKWKIACLSKIYFDDKQVGKIKLKAKGKCSCEVWKEWHEERVHGSDPPEFKRKLREHQNLEGRPKICKMKAYYCGEDDDEPYKLDLDQDKKHWREGKWDREWKCDDFRTRFQQNGWTPECEVKVDSEEMEPYVMLIYGFIVG